jgi:hypothetical protein
MSVPSLYRWLWDASFCPKIGSPSPKAPQPPCWGFFFSGSRLFQTKRAQAEFASEMAFTPPGRSSSLFEHQFDFCGTAATGAAFGDR